MKLFIVNVKDWDYDFVDSIVVIAKNKENAIKLAIEHDNFFKNNIGEVIEVLLMEEFVIHESIIRG